MSLREVASICRSSALVRLLLLTLVDCMKRILKPVGHCLTTIAMTSAMLEAYPAAVEAATPRPPAPTESAPTTPSPAVPLADEAPPTPRVVPPERIGTVEKSSKSDSARAVSQRQVPAPSTHAAASHIALAQAAAAATDQNQPQTAARPAAVPPAA
ncbi:MAG TPA: hypothetical protein IGS37_17175, partial [Synechococcales cyanobacterium M55_K2018_004]|nr:hypothetical protein [Synechococcales cyanobacterium M55_K2018_004]